MSEASLKPAPVTAVAALLVLGLAVPVSGGQRRRSGGSAGLGRAALRQREIVGRAIPRSGVHARGPVR